MRPKLPIPITNYSGKRREDEKLTFTGKEKDSQKRKKTKEVANVTLSYLLQFLSKQLLAERIMTKQGKKFNSIKQEVLEVTFKVVFKVLQQM